MKVNLIKRIHDPEKVRERIELLTDKVCGDSKGIVNKPIICTVYSSSVPDLTLIDLPGITRVPIDDQPEDIEKITKDMCRYYCRDENTIILCVLPANQDLSTQDSLVMAKKLDKDGSRTLGVLTKVDLMDEGTDCSKILMNKEIKLKLGYVAVKGRSQAEVNRKVSGNIIPFILRSYLLPISKLDELFLDL